MTDHSNNPKQAPKKGASFILSPGETYLPQARDILTGGGILAIPTETVYGLAANAYDEAACRSIFTLKGRPLLDPLIVHVHDWAQIEAIAKIDIRLISLASSFWPGALTVILKRNDRIPDIVTAGKPTVAVRMPRHSLARKLLASLPFPVAAPSANPFGYVSPTRPEHVTESFGDRSPWVLDGGPCEIGVESTILDLTDPQKVQLLRPGGISREQLENIIGPIHWQPSHHSENPKAPGMLLKHYSPHTPITLLDFTSPTTSIKPGEALIFQSRPQEESLQQAANTFWFSESGTQKDVAQNLFALIRQLDAQQQFNRLVIQKADPSGLGITINDRLERASAQED